jgi:hypothetical protein
MALKNIDLLAVKLPSMFHIGVEIMKVRGFTPLYFTTHTTGRSFILNGNVHVRCAVVRTWTLILITTSPKLSLVGKAF